MTARAGALAILALMMFAGRARAQQPCDKAGLTLPQGFCATVFADSVRGARHIVVAPNGDVFVASRNGLTALRDTTRDGRADMVVMSGRIVGSGIALRGTNLYYAASNMVLRYHIDKGDLLAMSTVDTIVEDLPTGGHGDKTIALGRGNDLFVRVGSRTNSCQQQDRGNESPGIDPCTELDTRAGIWRFDANKTHQKQTDGERYATGLRNVVALTFGPENNLYGVQHGRDQLFQNWGKLFNEQESADKPAEIFVRIDKGDDYGWPYCYFDREQNKHMLAPEYGGDGKQQGRCATIKKPLVGFPGHWAPNGVAFYTGTSFPAAYRGGVFIAFHGSWNRAPLPQAGYSLVFQPMKNGAPSGDYQVFAEGFRPGHRPVGLAVGPDGALFVTDDAGGRIYRITYR